MEIRNIIQGHLNEVLNKNEDLHQQRLQICTKCPIYSKKLGGVCNRKLYLNPVNGDISLDQKDGYYRGCGCRINAKTRLVNATCPAKKW